MYIFCINALVCGIKQVKSQGVMKERSILPENLAEVMSGLPPMLLYAAPTESMAILLCGSLMFRALMYACCLSAYAPKDTFLTSSPDASLNDSFFNVMFMLSSVITGNITCALMSFTSICAGLNLCGVFAMSYLSYFMAACRMTSEFIRRFNAFF